ncbi:unnamed protein product [Aphanomyces euteiches]
MRLLTTLALATCAVVAFGRPHRDTTARQLSGLEGKDHSYNGGCLHGSTHGYVPKPKDFGSPDRRNNGGCTLGSFHGSNHGCVPTPRDFGMDKSGSGRSRRSNSPKRDNGSSRNKSPKRHS